jgi:hypothetical protein
MSTALRSILASLLLLHLPNAIATAQSVLYSTSVPPLPPFEGEHPAEISAGVAYLVETLPTAVNRRLSPGGELMLRYSILPRLALGLKGWSEFSGKGTSAGHRSGVGLYGESRLSESDSGRAIDLRSHLALLFDGTTAKTTQTGVVVTALLPRLMTLYTPYLSLGGMLSFGNMRELPEGTRFGIAPATGRAEWGYGLSAAVGFSATFGIFRFHSDIQAIAQQNVFDDLSAGIVTSSVGVTCRL